MYVARKIPTHRDALVADSSLELRNVKLDLEKTARAMGECTAAATNSQKLKGELDTQYKELATTKKDKEKGLQQMMQKNAELQLQLDKIQHQRAERAKRNERDKQEVETERGELKSQQKHFDHQLESEKRKLQNQFNEMKRDLQSDFRTEVDALKTRSELQLSEVSRTKRAQLNSIRADAEKKLNVLEREHHDVHAKADQLTKGIQENEATIARLQSNLRRESMNSEIQGISKIDELKEQSIDSATRRDMKSKEKKIEQFRKKILDAMDEQSLVRRQFDHAEDQVNHLKIDVDDKDAEFHRLESERDEVERRLNARIEELTKLVSSRDDAAEAEYEATKKKLEADIEAQESAAKALAQEVEQLQLEQKQSKQFAAKLVEKVGSRLAAEGGSNVDNLSALEKAKRVAGSDARKARKDLVEVKDNVSDLEKEVEKLKKQYQETVQTNERLQAKNQKLEAAVRRVDTRL